MRKPRGTVDTVTIRMNQRMLARQRAQTDAFLEALDPGDALGLRALVDATREANGALPYREHDFQALLERLRVQELDGGRPPNGVTHAGLEALLVEARP